MAIASGALSASLPSLPPSLIFTYSLSHPALLAHHTCCVSAQQMASTLLSSVRSLVRLDFPPVALPSLCLSHRDSFMNYRKELIAGGWLLVMR